MARPTLPRGIGMKRSGSFAKKVLRITGMKIDPNDPPGIRRTSIAPTAGLTSIWDNLPSSPNPSPILCYIHDYDFSKPVHVDTTKTWTETAVAVGAANQALVLQDWAGYAIAHAYMQTGDSADDLYQYQERYFAYYPQLSYKRDLWFYIVLRGGAANEQIYIGYTPTGATAIASRQYGVGFFYDGTQWLFQTENNGNDQQVALGAASADWLPLGFHWHWRADPPGGAEITVLFDTTPQEVLLTGDNLILDQTLRLTLGIKTLTAHNALLGFRHMDEVIEK